MFTTKKKGVSLVCAAMLAIAGTTNVGIASSHADEAGTGLQITYECVSEENAVISGCGFGGQTSQKTTTDLSTAGIEAAINTAESDAVLKVMQLELQSQGFVLPIDRATIENGTVKVVPAEGLALANATYTFPLDSQQVHLHARVSQIASKASSTLLKFKVGKNDPTVGNTKFTGVGAQQTADGALAYVPQGGSYQFVYEGEPGTYPETTTGTLTRIRASQAYPNKVHELYEWNLASVATAAEAEVTVGKATSQTVELVVPYREEIYFADQKTNTAAVRDTKEGTKLTLKSSPETGQTGTRYLSETSTTGSFTFNIESNLESQSPTGYDGTFNYFIRGLEARDGAVASEQQTGGNMDNQQMTAFLKTMWTAHGENNANGWNFGLPEYVPWSQKTADEIKNESNRYSVWLDTVSTLLKQEKTKTFDSGPLAGVTVTAKYTDITPVKFTADAVKASDFNPSNAEGNQLKYILQVTLSNVTRANTVLMLDLFKNERRTGAGGYSDTMDEVYLANHGSIGTEGAPYSRCTFEHGEDNRYWNCLYQRGGLGFQDKREGEFSKGVLGNGWRFAPGGGASGYDASQVNRDGWGSPTFTDNPGIVMLAGGASTSFPMRTSSHVIGRDAKQNGPNSTIATLYFRIQDGFGGHDATDTSREQVTIETVRTYKDDRTIVEENSDKATLTDVGSGAEYVDSDPKQHVYVDAEKLHNLFARTDPFPGYANSIYASTAVKVPEAKMPYRVGEKIHGYVQPYSNPLLDVSDLPVPTVSSQGRYKYWQIKYQGLTSNSVFNNDAVSSTVHLTPANPIAKYDDVIQAVQFSALDGGRTYRSTRKYTDTYGNPTAKNITLEPVFDNTPLNLKQYTLSQQKASDPAIKDDVTFYGLPGLKLVLNNTYNDKTLQEVSYTRATDDYPNNEIQLAESSNAFVLKYDKTDSPMITKLVRTGNGGVEILLTDVNSATTTLTCKYTDSTVADATVHVATTTLTGNNTSAQDKVVFADPVPDGSTFTCTQQAHGITSGESNSKSLPLPKKTVGTAQLDSIDRANPAQPVLGGKVTVPDQQPDNTDKPVAVEVYNGDEYIGIVKIDSQTGKWSLAVPAAVADTEQLKLVPVNNTNHDLVTSRGQATTNPDRPSAPTIGKPTVATDGTITVPIAKPDNFKEGDILQCRLTDGDWPSTGTSNVNSAGNVVFPAAAEQTSENKSVECRTVRNELQSAATTAKTLPQREEAPTGVTAVRNEDNIQLSVADPNSAAEENGTGLTPYAVLPKKKGSTGETVAVPFIKGDDGKYVLDLENADLAESLASVDLDQAKKLTAIPVYYQDSKGNQSQAAPVAVPDEITQQPTIAGIDQDAGTLSATGAPASGYVQLVDEDGNVVATVQANAAGKVTFTAGADGVPADAFAAGKKYTVRAVDNQDSTKVTATGPASEQVTVPPEPIIGTKTIAKDGKVTVAVTPGAGSPTGATLQCRAADETSWHDVTDGQVTLDAEGKNIECRTVHAGVPSPSAKDEQPAQRADAPTNVAVTRNGDDLTISALQPADGDTLYAVLPKQGATNGETVQVPLKLDPTSGKYVLDLDNPQDGQDLSNVDVTAAKALETIPVIAKDAAGNESNPAGVTVPGAVPGVTGYATTYPAQTTGQPAQVGVTVPKAQFPAPASGKTVKAVYTNKNGQQVEVPIGVADTLTPLSDVDTTKPVQLVVVDRAGNRSAPITVTMSAALDTGVTAVKTDRDTTPAQLTGTAPSGATHVEVLDATGQVIATVPVTAGKFTLPENAAGGTDQDKLPAGALAAGKSVKLRPVKKNTDGTKAALGPISTVTVPSSPTVGAPTVARDGQVTVPVTAPAAAQSGDVLQCRVAGGSWPANGTSNVMNGKAVFAAAAAGKHVECRTINNGVASPTASSSGAVPEQPGAPTGVAALRAGDQLSVVANDPGADKIPYVLLPKQGATNGETVAVPLVKDATGKYELNLDDPANAAALKDVDVAAAKQQQQLPLFVQDQAGNQSPVANATVPGILPAVTGTATRTAPAAAGEPAQVTVTVSPAEFAKAGDNTVKVKYTKQNGETGFVEVPKADSPVALPADADLQQPIALVTADAQGNLSAASPVVVPAAINAVPEIQQLVFDKSAGAAAASVATVKVKGTPGQIVQLVAADQQPLGTATVGPDGLAVFTDLPADKIDAGVQARVVNAAQNPTSFGPLTAVREPLAAPTAAGLKLLRDRTGQVQVAAAGVLPQGQKRQCRLVGTESFVDLPHAFTASATDQLECRDVATGTAGVLVTSPVSAAVAVPAPVAAPTAVQAENHNGQVNVTAAKPAQDVTIYALVPSKDDPNKLVEVPLSADGAAAGKVQLDATAAAAAGADLNALAGKPVQLVAKRNDGTSESALTPGSVPATITGSATITGVTREGSPAGITGTYTGNAPFVQVTVGEKLVIAPVQNGSFQVPIGAGDDAFTAAELAGGAKLQVVGVNAPEDPTSFGEPSTALTIPAAPAAQSNVALADGTSKVAFAAPAAADEVLRCRIAGETEWFAADAQGVVLVPGGAGQELACQRVVGGVESPVAAVTASKTLPQITATGTRTAVADSAVDQVTVTVADAEMNKATAAGASVKAKYTDTSGRVQEIEIPVAQADKEVILPAADPTYPVYVYAADAAGNQAARNQVVLPKAITDAPVLTKVDTASKQPQVAGTVTFNPLADPQAPGETVNAQPTFVRIQDPAGNILAVVPVTYGTGAQANQGTFAADLNSNPQLQEYLAQAAAAGTPAQLQVVGQNAAVKPTAVGPDAPVKQVPAVPRVGAPKWTAAGTVVVPVTSSNAHDQLRCRKAGSTDSFVPVENGTATLTGLAAGDHIACQVANQDGSWQSPVVVGASAVPAQPAAPAVTVTYVPATGAEPASQVITVPADTAADRFYATYVDDQGVTQWVDITPVGALGAVNSDNMLGAKIPAAATGVKVIAVQAGSETAGVIPQVIASPVADLQVHQAGTGAAAQVVITGKVDPEQANAVELVLASGETLVVPATADGSFEIPAAQLTAADFTSDSNFKVRPVHANRQGELLVPDSYGAETAVTIPEEPAGLEQTTKHDGSVQVTYAGQDVRCRVPGQDWVAGASPLTIVGGAGVALECQRLTNGVQSPVAAVAAQAAPLAPTAVTVARNQQQQVVSIPAAQVPDSATLVVAGKEIPLVHNAATGRFEAVVAANVDLTGAQLYVTDAAGNESALTPVVVPPAIEAAPVVSAVTTSGNQATISGTVEQPAKFVQVLKDGQVLSTVPVTNGQWEVTGVPAAELARLQVRGIDVQDNPLVVGPAAAVGSVATPSFGSQYYDAAGQLHVEVTPAAGGKVVCYLGADRTTSYPGSPVVLPAGATGELHCKTVLAGKESVAVTAQLQPQPAAPAGVTVAVAAGQVSFHAPAQPAGVKLVLRVGDQEIPFVAAADGGLELNLSAYPDLEPAALAAAQLVALTPVPGSDPVVFSESKPAPVPAVPDFSSLAAEVSSDLDEISGTAQNAEQVRIAYFDETGAQQELTTGVDGDQYRVALANAHPGSPVFVTALQGSNTSAPVVKLLPVEITKFVPPTATAAGQLTGKAVSGAKVRITYQTISGEIKAIDVVAENNSFSAEIPQDAAPGTVISAVVVAYHGTAYENSAAREVQVPVQEAQPQPGAEQLPAQPVQPRQPAAGSTVLKCVATDQWNQLALGLVGVLGAIGAVMWLGENVLPPLELQPPAGLAGQLPLPDLLGGLALPDLLGGLALPEPTLPVVDLEPLGRQLAHVGLAGAIILLLAHNAHSCGSASS